MGLALLSSLYSVSRVGLSSCFRGQALVSFGQWEAELLEAGSWSTDDPPPSPKDDPEIVSSDWEGILQWADSLGALSCFLYWE